MNALAGKHARVHADTGPEALLRFRWIRQTEKGDENINIVEIGTTLCDLKDILIWTP